MKKVYFLNVDFGLKLTGIERSSLKRAFLFKNYLNIYPIFITSKLNVNLQKNVKHLKDIGWMPRECEVINVYDYLRYRGNNIKRLGSQISSLDTQNFEVIDVSEKHQRYRSRTENFSTYVVWHDVERSNLNYINYFFKSKKIKREFYDNNILYITQYLDDELYVTHEDIYDIDGNVILKRFYNSMNHFIERIEEYENFQLKKIYSSESDFISEWIVNYGIEYGSILIIDKNRFWSLAASKIKHQCKVISVIHSNHLKQSQLHNIQSGVLNSNYVSILKGEHEVDVILTLTQQQKNDIGSRFENLNNIVTIPHSIDKLPDKINFKMRNINKIVAVCRLAPEKQVIDMVLMMSELVKNKPNLKLHIYGDGGEKNKILEKIVELKLQNNIILEGYMDNISIAYEDAIFSLLTSRCEGFSLAILESLTYGVPVASYDIPYGPSSMIVNGVNGVLVEQGNYKKMAEELSNLVSDEVKLKEMSSHAYISTDKFLEKNVANDWMNLIIPK